MRRASIAAMVPPLAFAGALLWIAIAAIEREPWGVSEDGTTAVFVAAGLATIVGSLGAWRRVRGGSLRWAFVMVAAAVVPWGIGVLAAHRALADVLAAYEPGSWTLQMAELPALLASVRQLEARSAIFVLTGLVGVAAALALAGRESRWVSLAAFGLAIPPAIEAVAGARAAERLIALHQLGRGPTLDQVDALLARHPALPTWVGFAALALAVAALTYPLFRHRRQGAVVLPVLLAVPIAAHLEARDRMAQVGARVSLPRGVVVESADRTRFLHVVASAEGLHLATDGSGEALDIEGLSNATYFDQLGHIPFDPDDFPFVLHEPEVVRASHQEREGDMGTKDPGDSKNRYRRPTAAAIRETLAAMVPDPCLLGPDPFGVHVLVTPGGAPALVRLLRSVETLEITIVVERGRESAAPRHLVELFQADLGQVHARLGKGVDARCHARFDQRYLHATVGREPVTILESRNGSAPLGRRGSLLDGLGLVYLRVDEETSIDALLHSLVDVRAHGYTPILVTEWPADPAGPVENGPAPPTRLNPP